MDKKILIITIILLVALSPLLVCKKKAEEEDVEENGEENGEVVEEEEEVVLKGFIELNKEKVIGDYIITVVGYEIVDKTPDISPKSGNELVKVKLDVAYKKNSPWLISSALAFRVVGKGTDEIKTNKYIGADAFVDGMILAGETTGGVIVFEIPKKTKGLKLIADFTTQEMGKDTFDLKPPETEPPV